MDAVVFSRQHQMPVLEQRDPTREAKVGVAPLVNLIGQRHEYRQGEDVAVPWVARRQGLWFVCEEPVGHVSQWQDGDHAVVTVGFDEIVASDGGWIDVVLPERSNKCLANNWDVHRPPGIRPPVHHPRSEVCRHYPEDNAEDDLVDVDGGEMQEEEGEVDDEKKEAQNHTHPLLKPFPWRVESCQLSGSSVLRSPPGRRAPCSRSMLVPVRILLRHGPVPDVGLGEKRSRHPRCFLLLLLLLLLSSPPPL